MDSPSDRAPNPLAAWLAATEAPTPSAAVVPEESAPDHQRRGVRPRMVLIAVVPWLAVVALGATALGRSTPAVAPSTTPPVPAATPTARAEGAAVALDPRLAAAAVLTVRLAAPDEQYIDTAVAEGVHHATGAAIVTVAAAVLDRVDDEWTGPRPVRFAVPFAVDQSEPVALAPPWVLSGDEPKEAQPQATAIDDAALARAAGTALHAAGYRDIATPQLRRHDALPDILAVQVQARAPGEPAVRAHVIWLDAAGTRLLGAAAPPAPTQLPAPVPAEAP